MEPSDLVHLVNSTKEVFSALGKVDYGLKSSEIWNIKFRRSLYFLKDLPKNHIISIEDIKSVRPGYGISPSYFNKLIGKTLKYAVEKHEPVAVDKLLDLEL